MLKCLRARKFSQRIRGQGYAFEIFLHHSESSKGDFLTQPAPGYRVPLPIDLRYSTPRNSNEEDIETDRDNERSTIAMHSVQCSGTATVHDSVTLNSDAIMSDLEKDRPRTKVIWRPAILSFEVSHVKITSARRVAVSAAKKDSENVYFGSVSRRGISLTDGPQTLTCVQSSSGATLKKSTPHVGRHVSASREVWGGVR